MGRFCGESVPISASALLREVGPVPQSAQAIFGDRFPSRLLRQLAATFSEVGVVHSETIKAPRIRVTGLGGTCASSSSVIQMGDRPLEPFDCR